MREIVKLTTIRETGSRGKKRITDPVGEKAKGMSQGIIRHHTIVNGSLHHLLLLMTTKVKPGVKLNSVLRPNFTS